MAVVILHGELQQFGQLFELAVDTASEAMRALFCQLEGFQRHIANNRFFVRIAEQNIDSKSIESEFNQPLNELDEIHIVPEITGAGKFGQIILGAVLIGASFLMPAAGLLGGALTSSTVMMAGIGLVLGGVAQMLMKPPEFGDTGDGVKSNSSSFSNLANSTAQGSCVPVAYGEIMIGSKVISQSIESYKISGDTKDKPAGIVTTSRDYHTPVSVDGFSIDAADDSVIACNYTMRIA